jgi:hypothetical protein
MSEQGKEAIELAIELWRLRVSVNFSVQADALRKRERVASIVFIPPKDAELNTIQAALTAAEDRGIGRALDHVVKAIDAIDNGAKNGKARAALQHIYDALHAEKSMQLMLAK